MSPPAGPHGAPPTLSQSEAAKACGVSVATIRRARRSRRIDGAYEDGHGGWRIPIPALVAAGMLTAVTPPEGDMNGAVEGATSPQMAPPVSPPVPDADTERLRRELDEVRHRAERAEAIAAERERTIEVLQRSLRMLERGHSDDPPPPPEPTPSPPPTPEPPAKRGGLLGLLGF